MYLNLNSFMARIKHENLYTQIFDFIATDLTDVEAESKIKDLLIDIKEFNKNKSVIYSCGRRNDKVYKTMWLFAYENEQDVTDLVELVHEQYDYVTSEYPSDTEPTECPFRNNGELI